MKRTMGIIYSNIYDSELSELTRLRTVASLPFGARYRQVDFVLSNMSNSGISKIGIITKYNYQSLMDHLGSGKPWDLARKNDGMFLLPPYSDPNGAGAPDSRIDVMFNNIHFLERAPQEYVLMTDANYVANIDYNDVFKCYEESGADISPSTRRAQFLPLTTPWRWTL